ncbi:MAG: hypothetical protein F6J87_30405 [Spirulina sp. SIO3F2]|nr:hypothetical protein [Spirulina sp. SIO3F2]
MSRLCKFCGYYHPIGRRGGTCSLFNVPICGRQSSCCLATPAFKGSAEPVLTILGVDEFEVIGGDSVVRASGGERSSEDNLATSEG